MIVKSKYKQLSDALTCVVFEYAMELGLRLTEIDIRLIYPMDPTAIYHTDKGNIDLVTKWLDVEPTEEEITATAKRMIDDIANISGDGMIYHINELIHMVNDDGLWLDLNRNRCRLRTYYFPEVMAK